jgi:hypothetical protein
MSCPFFHLKFYNRMQLLCFFPHNCMDLEGKSMRVYFWGCTCIFSIMCVQLHGLSWKTHVDQLLGKLIKGPLNSYDVIFLNQIWMFLEVTRVCRMGQNSCASKNPSILSVSHGDKIHVLIKNPNIKCVAWEQNSCANKNRQYIRLGRQPMDKIHQVSSLLEWI